MKNSKEEGKNCIFCKKKINSAKKLVYVAAVESVQKIVSQP